MTFLKAQVPAIDARPGEPTTVTEDVPRRVIVGVLAVAILVGMVVGQVIEALVGLVMS